MSDPSNIIGPISMNDFRLMTMLKVSLKRFRDLGNPPKYAAVIQKEEELLQETIARYTKPTASEELAEAA